MKFQILLKVFIPIFIAIFISACSALNVTNKTILSTEKIIEEEKLIEYKREDISEDLVSRVYQLIQAMGANNLTLINQEFIHPSFGFFNLYKIDGIDIFTYQEMIYDIIEEDIEEISHLINSMRKLNEPFEIKLEEANFNCSPNDDTFYGWNTTGVYLNASTKTFLTDIMKESNKFEKDRYKKEDFQKAEQIEKTSYKVIITPNIVFYVTKIDDTWYLTLFDRVTTDCSS